MSALRAPAAALDVTDRRQRALEQFLTVTPDISPARGHEDLAVVTSQSGTEYIVDVAGGTCQQASGEPCPDQEYNLPPGEPCKHVIRAAVAMGETPLRAAEVRALDVDPQLGEHCEGPQVITTDGGVVDGREGQEASR